jgi:hypothetical protein
MVSPLLGHMAEFVGEACDLQQSGPFCLFRSLRCVGKNSLMRSLGQTVCFTIASKVILN